MRYEAVVFDLDGTLGDTLPVSFRAFRRVFARFLGHEPTDAEIHRMFGPTERGVLAVRLPGREEEALRVFLDAYGEEHQGCRAPFPGVRRLLERLRDASVRVAVVTGKSAETARISLECLGLFDLLPRIEGGGDAGARKPEALAGLLAEWEVPPERAAYVGDHPSDVRAARAVGVDALAAAWSPGVDRGALAAVGPDRILGSVAELERYLAS